MLHTIGKSAFRTFVTSKKDLQNFLQNIKHRIAYSARNFVDWQYLAEYATKCLNIEHCIPYRVKRVKSIFAFNPR